MITINFKKLYPETVSPKYAKRGDAAMDLVAVSKTENKTYIEYGTGIAVEIPEGYVGLIFSRSSISKYNLQLANGVGVIDSGYRGEIKIRFKIEKVSEPIVYEVGDRVAQLMVLPYPEVSFMEVEGLTTTERGEGGFGSSGK